MSAIFLTYRQVGARYGVHPLTPLRWPDFPPSVKLSPGCTRWRLSDIEAWEKAKAEES